MMSAEWQVPTINLLLMLVDSIIIYFSPATIFLKNLRSIRVSLE